MHTMYIPHANTVHMSHQGLSGTSVGPRTTFMIRFQDPGAVGAATSDDAAAADSGAATAVTAAAAAASGGLAASAAAS